MLGQKVAIVSSKPQTTRTRITGVLTQQETQLIFIDTPGLHKPGPGWEITWSVLSPSRWREWTPVCWWRRRERKSLARLELMKKFKKPVSLTGGFGRNKIDLLEDKSV